MKDNSGKNENRTNSQEKRANPLHPLKDVGLSEEEQTQMLQHLRAIMEEEESTGDNGEQNTAALRRHRRTKSLPTWVKTTSAGVAAVIVVGGILFGMTHNLSSSTTATNRPVPSITPNVTGPAVEQYNNTLQANQTNSTQVQSDNQAGPSPTNQVKAPVATPGFPLSHFHPAGLTAANFVNNQIGFIAGKDGIYKTNDGGQTWTKVYTSTTPILGLTTNFGQDSGKEYIWASAWTKSGIISSYQNGDKWVPVKINLPNMSAIQDVSQLTNSGFLFIMNGTIWTSKGDGSGWLKVTPPERVVSVAQAGMNTYYAATVSGSVYQTSDGGQTWTKMFTAPIVQSPHWQAEVQARGNNVAVYYYGGAAGMSQQAYVMYESTDAGQTWKSLFDEAYFPAYGKMKPQTSIQLSLQPGPFSLLDNGSILFAGISPRQTNVTTLYKVTPSRPTPSSNVIGSAANPVSVFGLSEMPMGLASPDGQNIIAVGENKNKGVLERSTDGGQTWQGP